MSKKQLPLNKNSRIYLAGHTGMVGSAIHRRLKSEGYNNIITRTHSDLDLIDQQAVRSFFKTEKIDTIFLAAAKVGGIQANMTYGAEFLYSNLMVQLNVIHQACGAEIQHLLFLGSSCIYPRLAPQPMKEEYLMTGPLEPTNEPYAIAKVAGIKTCESYNRQYGTKYRSVMPTNLYGPNDNYDLQNSHLMAALIRKFHLAKLAMEGDWEGIKNNESDYGLIPEDIKIAIGLDPTTNKPFNDSPPPKVILWGTGTPRREFLHVDDMAEACIFLMKLTDKEYESQLLTSESEVANPSFYNIGTGKDNTIRELAELTSEIIGFKGEIVFDPSIPDGMPQKLLDVSRLQNLGWKPRISLSEGIRQAYEFYQK